MINKYFGLSKVKLGRNANVFVDKRSKAFLERFIQHIQKKESDNHHPSLLFDKYPQSVAVILVTYDSEPWLAGLIKNILDAEALIKEVIVVDNGSTDNSIGILRDKLPQATVLINENNHSLASGINLGVRQATADFLLIINPDIEFSVDSILYLLKKASAGDGNRIAVPKLYLMENPQFLNGVGNFVGPFFWGYDCGLGHLDVGQFDDIETLPSACFAAVLIPKKVIDAVGLLDEGYGMYYEDVDWCKRATLKNIAIRFAPKASVFHAYGGHQDAKKIISTRKLENVTYGRLRLIKKLAAPAEFFPLLLSYLLFDLIYSLYSLLLFRFKNIAVIIRGWKKFISEYKTIKNINMDKKNLFGRHQKKFFPRIKNGLPVIIKGMIKKGEYR